MNNNKYITFQIILFTNKKEKVIWIIL